MYIFAAFPCAIRTRWYVCGNMVSTSMYDDIDGAPAVELLVACCRSYVCCVAVATWLANPTRAGNSPPILSNFQFTFLVCYMKTEDILRAFSFLSRAVAFPLCSQGLVRRRRFHGMCVCMGGVPFTVLPGHFPARWSGRRSGVTDTTAGRLINNSCSLSGTYSNSSTRLALLSRDRFSK